MNKTQDRNCALKDIDVQLHELREATISLGLKLTSVDLPWDTLVAQFNLALQRMQESNIDVTSFVVLEQMLNHLKADLASLKTSTFVALTDLLASKDNEEFFKRLKKEKNQAKAAARLKRKLAADTEQVSEKKSPKLN